MVDESYPMGTSGRFANALPDLAGNMEGFGHVKSSALSDEAFRHAKLFVDFPNRRPCTQHYESMSESTSVPTVCPEDL